MIGRAGRWTRTPSATPLQPKKLNAHFRITFNFWWSAGLIDGLNPICHCSPVKKIKCWFIVGLASMDSKPVCHPSPAKKIKWSLLDYIQLLMIGWAGRWTQTPSATLSSQKNKMLVFGLHSTSDDWLGWSMDSNPVHHPSPVKKIKCSFLDYIQLLMIGQAGRWTWTPSAIPLPKNKMLIFRIMFNFWWPG